jgi:hypothetical protein
MAQRVDALAENGKSNVTDSWLKDEGPVRPRAARLPPLPRGLDPTRIRKRNRTKIKSV